VLSTILSFLSSLAWPTVTVIIALVFKSEISGLVLRLSNLKYKDLELTFGEDLKKAEALAKKLNLSPSDQIDEMPELKPKLSPHQALLQLADTYPEAAVLEAWRLVEIALISAAKSLQIDMPEWNSVRIISELKRLRKIDDATASFFEGLRRLRNKAAHVPSERLTPEQATGYVELALSLAASLKDFVKS